MPTDPSASPRTAPPLRLGILAGSGPLPRRLIETCLGAGRPFFVLAFDGETEAATVAGTDHAWVRVGAVGKAISLLRQAGCGELVLAGPVKRRSIAAFRPDWRGLQFFARVGRRAWGDDGLLSAVIYELEGEGFSVIGAEAILPTLLAPKGPFGRRAPDAEAMADIERGIEILNSLGALDIGQAVVIQQGVVLGVEAVEGTDRLMERCKDLHREGRAGVLVKMPKPGQESRVDAPTIGSRTVERAHRAGLAGIAVEAGGTIVLDRDAVGETADRLGLFVYGFERR
ncbi:MAG: UDP-2,3-diacylglucosamine diphosphatase LpxI [Rhodospirillaceae bacterium]|nr:UDP-2,3-diacylglucosamine diphosphatase LpxI [Rhodospirillaceae bacterium]